ncbi:MAG: DUF2461 domain-containing protein [Treponemataceae bacterium]
MPFAGFGPGTLPFLHELSFNNTKEWFAENKARYEAEICEPASAFIMALGTLLSTRYPTVVYDTRRNGAGSLMRIYRDIRFSPDKRPLKENVGIIFPLSPGKKVEVPIFYFHIELGQAFFYGGQHVFTPEALDRYRRAVDDEKTGPALQSILAALEGQGLRAMEEPKYKRVPRGYPADHPRADLLRQAALGVGIDFGQADLGRADLTERCREAAELMQPLMDWLATMNARA